MARLPDRRVVVSRLETTVEADRSNGFEGGSWGDDLAVLISHRPILDRGAELKGRGIRNAGGLLDGPALTQALTKRSAPTIVMAGHLHVRDCHGDGNVLQVICPALVEDPAEVAVVNLSLEDQLVVSVSFYPVVDGARSWPTLVDRETSWTWAEGKGWTYRGRPATVHTIDATSNQARPASRR
jgi:hypothetical protein